MMKLFFSLFFILFSTVSTTVQATLNTTKLTFVTLQLSVADQLADQQNVFVSLDDAGDIDLKGLEFTTYSNNQYPDHVTTIDIVIVKVPEPCRGNSDKIDSCDWATLAGVGAPMAARRNNNNNNYLSPLASWFCCTKDARADKACTAEQYGHLIIDATKFQCEKKSINITSTSSVAPTTFASAAQDSWFFADHQGDYAIFMANCHAKSKTVKVDGSITVESFELKKTMAQVSVFHILLAICYIFLMMYFYQLMQVHKASRIMLEEWIMTVIVLGFFEIFLRAIEYHIWAHSGERAGGLAFVAMLFGAAKHSLGKCLLLLLSLGWGVVRDSLVIKTLGAALFLSMALFLVTISFDILIFYVSHHEDKDVGQLFMTLFRLQCVIEAIFMIWIPCALCSTMKYIRSTDQHVQKLARYRVLLRIIVGGTMLTCLTIIIMFTDLIPGFTYMMLTETNQVNFFIILTFVAMVWKPNPYAREYTYSSLMDLSLEGGGGGDDDYHHHANRNAASNAQSTVYMELADSTPDVVMHQPQHQHQQPSWMMHPHQQQFS